MEVFRGYKDKLPSQLTPDYITDGIYGHGVYFTKRKEVARWYSIKSCDIFGLIVSYKINNSSLLNFKEDEHFKDDHPANDFFNLTSTGRKLLGIKTLKITKNSLMNYAEKLGHIGIDISIGNYCENIVVLKNYSNVERDVTYFLIGDEEHSNPTEKFMKKEVRKLKLYINGDITDYE